MSDVPVFEPVDPESTGEPELEENQPEPNAESASEEYPLAGPILDEARDRVLRGRCGECDTQLRVEVDDPEARAVRVRCPICSNTRRVEL